MNRKLKALEPGIGGLTANGVSVALTEELARRFPPEVIAGHIQELLEASLPDKVSKDGEVTKGRPDALSRGTGLRLLLGYLVGEPIKRVAVQDVTPRESDSETQERLARSPAAQRALAGTLADTPEGRAAMEAALASGRAGAVVEMAEG